MALEESARFGLEQQSMRQIGKSVTSDFIGNFSNSLVNFAISLFVLKVTGSSMSFGTTLLIGPAVGILFSPLIGYIADHFDNKRVIIWSQLSCIVLLLGYAFVFSAIGGTWRGYILILILVATLSLNTRIFSVAYMSAVSQLVTENLIQKLNALEQSAVSLATIAGPVAAGVLFAFVPFNFFIYFEIGAELLVLLIVSQMNFHLIPASDTAPNQSETMMQSIKVGLSYVRTQPLILYLIVAASMINFFFGIFQVGFPYLMVHVLHLSNLQYSLNEALFSLGMVVGGLLSSQLSDERNPLDVASKGLVVAGIPVIGAMVPVLFHLNGWLDTGLFSAISFVTAIALVFVNVPMQTYLQKNVPSQYQGRVFTIIMVGATSLMPLGMFIYGLLFKIMSPIPIIIASFIGFMIVGVFVRQAKRKEGWKAPMQSVTEKELD
ncbi:MAG: MFS transporter [Sporolactobacillus sp.]